MGLWEPFPGKVAAPLHRDSSSLSPGAGFFSSCFCSVDGVSRCQGSGSFCPLPFCSWGGGNGIRKGEGWAPLLSVPRKASRQTLPPAVAQADPSWEGVSDDLLSSSSPDASSNSLGLQLGVAVFLWHVSPVAHIAEGRARCPSTQGWPQQWQEVLGWGTPEGRSWQGQLPWSCW